MKLATALFVFAAVCILNVRGAFENILCKKNSTKTNVYLPCDTDCKRHHGALSGECTGVEQGDFNCYCKGRSKEIYEASIFCMEPTDNFRELCTTDCICNHGATGGNCDWSKKACICHGDNPKNKNCPYDNVPDYALFVYRKVGEKNLGVKGMALISPFLKPTVPKVL